MNIYTTLGLIALVLWLIPAIIFTAKVKSHPQLDKDYKKHLIIPLWTAPIIGNLVCVFVFAKTGKLNKLSHGEHVSAASTMSRR